ncbi:MAG: hypothetical protein HYX62_03755 [Gammaproteobacteria bacterium]|nr:hypothetical protein [Gammaproteobacteria bacterium]
MNKNKIISSITLMVAGVLSIAGSEAHEYHCNLVSGSVVLAPDAGCGIKNAYPGLTYVGLPNTCFSVRLTMGGRKFSGVAGLTAEGMAHPLEGSRSQRGTPAMLKEQGLPAVTNEFGLVESRRLFTGRTALSLSGGKVYTADAGVAAGPSSTEQMLITGGSGVYAGAKGTIYTTGDLVGKGGGYFGKICTPAPRSSRRDDD